MPCTVNLALWNVAIMRFLCSARSPRENRDIKHSGLTLQKKKNKRERCVSWFLPSRLGMDVIDSLVT